MKVCLDAGHGGVDPGAVANGLLESHLTLAISKKVQKILEAESDIDVVMTRVDELQPWEELGLWERCNISNQAHADCFVSIHCNAAENHEAYGSETFYCRGSANGATLARTCQNGMNNYCLDMPERRVEGRGFYVLKHTHAPAALVECGFLTNTKDAELLQDADFQQRCAQGIAEGILHWLRG